MKTNLLSGAALAILGLAIGSLSAQTQSTTTSTTSNYIETSKLIGTKVRSSDGDVGTIKDVVLDNNGCMAYTVLSTGGGGGGSSSRTTSSTTTKTVAVPWSVYDTTSFTPDSRVVNVRVDRQRIYSAPAFEYNRIEEYSRPDYISGIYSYYGVQPAVGLSVGVATSISEEFHSLKKSSKKFLQSLLNR